MIDGDQKLFSGSADNSVRMWDVATSESEVIYLDNGVSLNWFYVLTFSIIGLFQPIFSLILLPAERQLLIGASAIILWDLNAYTALRTLGDSEIDASFTCMALLQSKAGKDTLLAVGSTDGLIRVWNATQGVMVSTLGEKATEDGSGTVSILALNNAQV
jgi:WD40 repeat protein